MDKAASENRTLRNEADVVTYLINKNTPLKTYELEDVTKSAKFLCETSRTYTILNEAEVKALKCNTKHKQRIPKYAVEKLLQFYVLKEDGSGEKELVYGFPGKVDGFRLLKFKVQEEVIPWS